MDEERSCPPGTSKPVGSMGHVHFDMREGNSWSLEGWNGREGRLGQGHTMTFMSPGRFCLHGPLPLKKKKKSKIIL